MNTKTRKIAIAAVIAAIYAAVTMLLAPISYGAVQFRISEVLNILPFFLPFSTWGLFVGCIIANLISSAGILDVVFGSLATLLACLCIGALGKWKRIWPARILACLMPVVHSGVIVGAALSATLVPKELFFESFPIFGLEVAAGEAAVMFLIGLPLLIWLPRTKAFKDLIRRYGK